MIKFLLPVLLGLVGFGGGVGAKLMLFPDPAPEADPTEAVAPHECPATEGGKADHTAPAALIDAEDLADREFVKLKNQFVVPLVTNTQMAGLVVLSVTIETKLGGSELVYTREPKLRDLFLQTLFDQASLGRFNGAFATASNLRPLRDEMLIVARRVLGDEVSDVLITDLARQDG